MVAFVPKRRALEDLSRWASVALFVFMVLLMVIPFIPLWFDSSGSLVAYVRNWLFLPLAMYIAIQFLETASRRSTDTKAFVLDNGIAFACLLVGIITFVLLASIPSYRFTPDQFHIMLQCTVWAAVDFVVGIMTSLRIAFAGKEREEEFTH